ncbi:MAG: nucleoside deaminase, partial [Spirochaetales bacterium]|nr:nucleoside deaminase [Spirochaetales bacterium]
KDLHDATAHAERMLASRASQKYSKDFLWKCTLYTTFEPCCMCTGAIYWANIGRIVYGLTEEKLLELTGSDEKNPTFNISSRTILAAGQKPIEVLGPFEEIAQAVEEVHRGFWNAN